MCTTHHARRSWQQSCDKVRYHLSKLLRARTDGGHASNTRTMAACMLLATRGGRGRPYIDLKHAGRNLTKILYSFLTSNSSLRQMSSLVEWKLSLTCKEPLQWWRGCGITQPGARCPSAVLRRYPRGFVKCDASFSQPVQ